MIGVYLGGNRYASQWTMHVAIVDVLRANSCLCICAYHYCIEFVVYIVNAIYV
jgi:hypothetical protein